MSIFFSLLSFHVFKLWLTFIALAIYIKLVKKSLFPI